MLRIAFVAEQLVQQGVIVLVATVGPHDEHRKAVRAKFRQDCFIQVYTKASVADCERRDVKGMYRLAREGKLPLFTGVGASYEEPSDSEVVCLTAEQTLGQCVRRVLNYEGVRKALARLEAPYAQML